MSTKSISITVEILRSPSSLAVDWTDQDRAVWDEADRVACVCDGLASSPYSEEAAEFVAKRARRLFKDRPEIGIRWFRRELMRRRRQAALRPLVSASLVPSSMLKAVGREKLSRSFRTTLISAQLSICQTSLAWVKVGDSDIVVFDGRGAIVFGTRAETATRISMRTEALPDDGPRATHGTTSLPGRSLIILGSDGFFGAFPRPSAMRAWVLRGRRDAGVLAELHARLAAVEGKDDDLSAVILRVTAIGDLTRLERSA